MKGKLLILAATALLLAGCGGGGAATNTSLSKDGVLDLLASGITGIGNLHQKTRSTRAASKSYIPKPFQKAAPSAIGKTRDGEEVWFHEGYQLYVVDFMDGDPSGNHTWGERFYEDQGLTKPAGHDIWESAWGDWPTTDDEDFTITAGPSAGTWFQDHNVLNQDGTGSDIGHGFDPAVGAGEWTITWNESGDGHTIQKNTALDGSWLKFDGGVVEDGTAFVITTSAGLKFNLHFSYNGSGTGTIEGASSLLPATIEWDDQQIGTIHWADGTTTSFEGWNF